MASIPKSTTFRFPSSSPSPSLVLSGFQFHVFYFVFVYVSENFDFGYIIRCWKKRGSTRKKIRRNPPLTLYHSSSRNLYRRTTWYEPLSKRRSVVGSGRKLSSFSTGRNGRRSDDAAAITPATETETETETIATYTWRGLGIFEPEPVRYRVRFTWRRAGAVRARRTGRLDHR